MAHTTSNPPTVVSRGKSLGFSHVYALHDINQRRCPEERHLAGPLAKAGIEINGDRPWDIQIRDQRVYRRIFAEGSIGIGESYVDGWWDVEALDEFFFRVFDANLENCFQNWTLLWHVIKGRLLNMQSKSRSPTVARRHYDLGNDIYGAMLDRRMQYTCAYWKQCDALDQAQENKLHLICKKLALAPGMRVLELGGGFGGLANFMAAEYGCHVVSYNISKEQVRYAVNSCRGLPVRFECKDYREAVSEPETFDRVVSIGLCEHVGYKNHHAFLKLARAALKPGGLFLLHTIGGNISTTAVDPWIDKYIFPGGVLPSIAQLGRAMETLWVLEDLHNFGPDYDRTLMAWWHNFDRAWPELRQKYGDAFYRMWRFYLMSCAGGFRSRRMQLWQMVLSMGDIPSYAPVR